VVRIEVAVVVVEFMSAAPRPDDIQEAPSRKQNETSPDPGCSTCTRATRANPHSHSLESKDEIWVSNHRLGQFRISAPVTRLNPNPGYHSRCGPAASQASLCALTANLDRSVLRDRKGTQTEDLASNNPKDKRRTINTRQTPEIGASEVRCGYLAFASIEE
jgi:hypothetical protein